MAGQKKILISLPEPLLEQLDALAGREEVNRSEMIRQAVKQMLERKHTMEIRERMRRGYEEMAGMNLEWAELGLAQDQAVLGAYEEKLSECEKP